jgi:branched-chain amino acid transport system permease protein
MHYDHAGNLDLFPNATFHIQDREMMYCTGRCMCHPTLRDSFEPADVIGMVTRLFAGRAKFHDGAAELAPGISLHFIGGHTMGLQSVRVLTRRGWVVLASLALCLATWFLIERTKLGSYLRAATENPALVQAFGINVPRMITLTYGFGVALAALAGVMAAPIYQVSPLMGADLIIVVFAVVVIGGMGSILGSIVTGFVLGVVEGLTKVFYPEASNTVIFVIMAIVLLIKPAGLFGRTA